MCFVLLHLFPWLFVILVDFLSTINIKLLHQNWMHYHLVFADVLMSNISSKTSLTSEMHFPGLIIKIIHINDSVHFLSQSVYTSLTFYCLKHTLRQRLYINSFPFGASYLMLHTHEPHVRSNKVNLRLSAFHFYSCSKPHAVQVICSTEVTSPLSVKWCTFVPYHVCSTFFNKHIVGLHTYLYITLYILLIHKNSLR